MRCRVVLALAAVLVVAPLRAQPPEASSWRAGAAKTVITPRRPLWMSGYSSRTKPAEGKVHDLWAKAIVLQAGAGRPRVLVTLDLVGIDRELSRQVCAELKKRHDLARDEIILACSHTHCGPVVGDNLRSMYTLDAEQSRRVDEYAQELRGKIIDVVGAALQALAPARLTRGEGLATFAVNRRTNKEADVPKLRGHGALKGPVDHRVPVLAVRAPDGALRAVVFGYACHATVLSFQQWCGDYPGFAQRVLEKENPDAIALFWAGCGGDQNPLPRRSVALAQKYGDQLAAAVQAVLDAPMRSVAPALRSAYTEIDLPFATLPAREALVKDLQNKNRFIAARAKMLLARLEKDGSLRRTYPYPVQAWRLGDGLTWLALGGEVVVDYALRLRRELGDVWVTAYANDVMAYIPSQRVLKEGGYEGGGAMLYYGQPGVWGPRVEELIVAAAHAQAKRVRSAKSNTP